MAEMPRELYLAPVSGSAKSTLSHLWSYATPGRPICWPSAGRLANESGQHVRTIKRHLAELTEAGLIRRQSRGAHVVWELLTLAAKATDPMVVIDASADSAHGDRDATPAARASGRDVQGGDRDVQPPVTGMPPKLTSELTNELNARAMGSGDGLGPAAPRSRKSRTSDRGDPSPPETRATDAQVVDLCSALASEVQDPALRALVESKGRGAVASLPELLARVRKPPAKKAPGVACARTIARGTG